VGELIPRIAATISALLLIALLAIPALLVVLVSALADIWSD